MMDQLIKQVAEKTGLDEAKAKEAIDVVMAYLKDHLTADTLARVTSVVGESSIGSALGSLAERVGGLFGRKE